MSAGYSTPCSGELEFWTVMRSQMVMQTKQLTRIATALERIADRQPAESGLPDGSSVSPSPWSEPEAALEPKGGGE